MTTQIFLNHPSQFAFEATPMKSIRDTGFQKRILDSTEGASVDPHFHIDPTKTGGTLLIVDSKNATSGVELSFNNVTSALLATAQPNFGMSAIWLLSGTLEPAAASTLIEKHFALPESVSDLIDEADLTYQMYSEIAVASAGATIKTYGSESLDIELMQTMSNDNDGPSM
ncbi:hypothetical protein [Marinobacter sp. ELB17]|uniref:hypothetical protein n=1 Tax=Marinobacter sp. ELB17 TaxID=270374 RepID=UPI0000F39C5F|nr:hypothetical protein [Marinobacter sp. ELB17]EAZ97247.1 hypothetical protein MELB17_10158 [Marinobacter sp. ELB17]